MFKKGFDNFPCVGKCFVCYKSNATYRQPFTNIFYCGPCHPKQARDMNQYYCTKVTNFLRCQLIASFGIEGSPPIYCGNHRGPNDRDVKHKKCEMCNMVQAHYDLVEYTKNPRYCGKCVKDISKTTGKPCEDKVNDKCTVCKITLASYGTSDGRKTHCGKCKLPDMIDNTNDMCEVCDITRPSFSLPGGSLRWCKSCIPEEYKNIAITPHSKQCSWVGGCKKRPMYGPVGGDYPEYCVKHKKIDHIDLVSKLCQHVDCTIIATFGIENYKPTRCKLHKTANMKDQTHEKCALCDLRGDNKVKGDSNGYCLNHAIETSAITGAKVIHANKRCEIPSCLARAMYAPYFQRAIACGAHAKPGWTSRPNPRCSSAGCKNPAHWREKSSLVPTLCDGHKTPDSVDMVENPCIQCGTPGILNSENMCSSCSGTYLNGKFIRKKEEAVKEALAAAGIQTLSHNKTIPESCLKTRPDFIIDHGTYHIIVEVDEDQHKHRNAECEHSRMVNIHSALMTPLVFIRFNPDKYINKQGKSCGAAQKRLKALTAYIKSFDRLEHLEPGLYTVHMYFDGYDETPVMKKVDYIEKTTTQIAFLVPPEQEDQQPQPDEMEQAIAASIEETTAVEPPIEYNLLNNDDEDNSPDDKKPL